MTGSIKLQNTDPLLSDTDNDGLWDGWNEYYHYHLDYEYPQYSDDGNIGGDLYL